MKKRRSYRNHVPRRFRHDIPQVAESLEDRIAPGLLVSLPWFNQGLPGAAAAALNPGNAPNHLPLPQAARTASWLVSQKLSDGSSSHTTPVDDRQLSNEYPGTATSQNTTNSVVDDIEPSSDLSVLIDGSAILDTNLNALTDHQTGSDSTGNAAALSRSSASDHSTPHSGSRGGGSAARGEHGSGGSGGGGSSGDSGLPKRPGSSGGGGGSSSALPNINSLTPSNMGQLNSTSATPSGSTASSAPSGSTGAVAGSDSPGGGTPAETSTSHPPRANTLSLGFADGLSPWNIQISGGSESGRGSVTAGSAILREGDSYLVSLDREFEVPENADTLVFRYDELNFDTSDLDSINDAFEASLVDLNGQTLVHSFGPNRDAFFNVTEGESAALGSEATLSGNDIKTITLDVSGIQPGTQAILRFRLVNNDDDTLTSVHILDVTVPGDDVPTTTLQLLNDTAPAGPGADPFQTDGLTNDPRVTGIATDDLGVSRLEIQTDDGSFVDITSSLGTDGAFIYDPGILIPGLHRITVRATDTGNQIIDSLLEFRVNAPPVPNAGGPRTVNEGESLDFDGAGSSDDEAPIFRYQWRFPDGTTSEGSTSSYPFTQNGTFAVDLSVTDTAGSVVNDTAEIAVDNLPAVIDPIANQQSAEAQAVTFTTTFSDPGVLDTHTATIDWGDGTPPESAPIVEQNGVGTVSGTHSFKDDGLYSVTVRVNDSDGDESSTHFDVLVSNHAPTVITATDLTGNEGQLLDFSATFTDAGILDTHAAIVSWSDGTQTVGTVVEANGSGTVTASHVFADNGVYPIRVDVTDNAGDTGSRNATGTVSNVDPTVVAATNQTFNEGESFLLNVATFSDPGFTLLAAGTQETFTANINWGDGTPVQPGTLVVAMGSSGVITTGTVSGTHAYANNGQYTVNVTVTDDDGGIGTASFLITVRNLAPTVISATDLTGNEGQSLNFSATFTDAGIFDTHSATVSWSDGTQSVGTVVEASGSGTVTASHVFADNGVYPIRVVVTDSDGDTDRSSATVTVSNVRPTVVAATSQTVTQGQSFNLNVSTFSDPGFTRVSAGTSETFTASINWGDGTPVQAGTLVVVMGAAGIATTGTVSGTHTYATNGQYTVTVTVTDDDGGAGSAQFGIQVIAATGTKFFVVDQSAHKTFRYGVTGNALGQSDLSNSRPRGVASNVAGDTVWVIDANKKVYVYNAQGTLLGSWNANGINQPQDITTDGTNIWIVDDAKNMVYRYANAASRRSGSQSPGSSFSLASQNKNASGIVTNGTTLWVTDDGPQSHDHDDDHDDEHDDEHDDDDDDDDDDRNDDDDDDDHDDGHHRRDSVFVYDLSGHVLGQWNLDSTNGSPSGITLDPSGGNDLWVVDRHDAVVYHYANSMPVRAGGLTASSAFALAANNQHPEGIADPPTHADMFMSTNHSDDVPTHNQVYRFDVSPGGVPILEKSITDPGFSAVYGLAVSSEGELFVSNRGLLTPQSNPSVSRFTDITDEMVPNGSIPKDLFKQPFGVAFRGNELFVAENIAIGYTGGPYVNIDRFLFDEQGTAIPNGTVQDAMQSTNRGFAVAPWGELFISQADGRILRYLFDSTNTAIPNGVISGGGLNSTHDIEFSPWGELFAANSVGSVSRFTFDSSHVASSNGIISTPGILPLGIAFSPWGELFAAHHPSGGAGRLSRWSFDDSGNAVPSGSFETPDAASDLEFYVPPAPTVSVNAPTAGSLFNAGTTVLITGHATAPVMISGRPVDVFDAAGAFFAQVQISPGENHFTFIATDDYGQTATESLTLFGTQSIPGEIDFSLFSDVTGSFTAEYARTSLNEQTDILIADWAIRNSGQYPADVPLYVGVTNISDPKVRVHDPAGLTPDSVPYFDFTPLVADNRLSPSEATGTASLSFFNPEQIQFKYDLVFFGMLNRAPAITSIPDVEVLAGRSYLYDVDAVDPDGDALSWSLVTAPQEMQIDSATGLISWAPTSADIGVTSITVRAEDGRGGSTEQRYVLSVIDSPPNRPPVFTSVPVVSANVNTPYSYDADAADPDGDELSYSVVGGPAGLIADEQTGLLSWSPSAGQLGPHDVTLQVTDGQGGIAQQSYTLLVGQQPGNHPPVIVSEPVTTYVQTPTAIGPLSVIPGYKSSIVHALPQNHEVTGVAVDSAGQLYFGAILINGSLPLNRSIIYRLDTTDGVVDVLKDSGLSYSARMAVGDGAGEFGADLIHADWNFAGSTGGIDGTVYRTNTETGQSTILTVGGVNRAVGDPFGVAIGPGGAFGHDVYIMDPQGASSQPPVLQRITAMGERTVFAEGPQWTTSSSPWHIDFSPAGSAFGEFLYVADPATDKIWRVDAAGVISEFLTDRTLSPTSLRFSRGGLFGEALLVLDTAGRIVRVSPDGIVLPLVDGLPNLSYGGAGSDFALSLDGSRLFIGNANTIYEIAVDPANPPYSYDVDAIDPDDDQLLYSLVDGPTGASIDPLSGVVTWPVLADDLEVKSAFRFGSSSQDLVRDVSTDDEGNVYQTGTYQGTVDLDPGPGTFFVSGDTSRENGFIQKFDKLGNFVWARAFVGAPGSDTNVDSDGNVYVAGWFSNLVDLNPGAGIHAVNSAGSIDGYVVKLDSTGSFNWAHTIGGAGDDMARYIAFDSNQNPYISSHFSGTVDFDPGSGTHMLTSAGLRDAYLWKLTSAGDFLWANQIGGVGDDSAFGVATDSAGNAFVTGYFRGTVDFDPGSGTVPLVSVGGVDGFLAKFGPEGELAWARAAGHANDDTGIGVVVDNHDAAYVSGWRGTSVSGGLFDQYNPGSQQFGVIQKFVPNGDLAWSREIGTTGDNRAVMLDIDDLGCRIHVAGWFEGTTDFDAGPEVASLTSRGSTDGYVLTLDEDGRFVSVRQMGGPSRDEAIAIARGPSTELYVAGLFENSTIQFDSSAGNITLSSAGQRDAFTAKYFEPERCPDVTVRVEDGRGGFDTQSFTIDVVSNRPPEIISEPVTDAFAGFPYNYDVDAVDPDIDPLAYSLADGPDGMSIDPTTGEIQWPVPADVPQFGSAFQLGAGGNDYGRKVVSDAAGNLYVSGFYTGIVDFDPGPAVVELTSGSSSAIFIAKYSQAGDLLWVRSSSGVGTVTPLNGLINGLTLGADGYLYGTGGFQGTADFDPGPGVFNLTSAGDFDNFVWKLDSDGNFIWARQMGGALPDQGIDVITDAAGNVYATGIFQGTSDFDPGAGTLLLSSAGSYDAFAVKLNSDGNLVWARRIGGDGYDEASSIDLDGAGNVYLGGGFAGTVDFDPGAGTFNRTSAGDQDAFVLKLTIGGDFVWSRSWGGSTGRDRISDIAVTDTGDVYSTGIFIGTGDFDPGADTSQLSSASVSAYDIFLSKLDAAGQFVWAKQVGGTGDDGVGVLQLDEAENVHVVGAFQGTVDFDPGPGTVTLVAPAGNIPADPHDGFILKLDKRGEFDWARSFGGAGNDGPSGLAIDCRGNIFLAGLFQQTVDFDPGAGTHNLTSAGAYDVFVMHLTQAPLCADVTVRVEDGRGGFDTQSFSIDVLTNRPPEIVSQPVTDAFVGHAYSYDVDAVDPDYDPLTYALTSAPSGMAINPATGVVNWANPIPDPQFANALQAGAAGNDWFTALATDADGNSYVSGFITGVVDVDPGPSIVNVGTAGLTSALVVKYSRDGQFLWGQAVPNAATDGLVVDDFGTVSVIGGFTGTVDFDPGVDVHTLTASGSSMFIWRLSTAGTFISADMIGGLGGFPTFPLMNRGVSVGADGSLLISGGFQGTVDFDPGPGFQNLTATAASSTQSAFLLKLDRNRQFQWVRQFGNAAGAVTVQVRGQAHAMDDDGNVIFAGGYYGTVDLDPGAGEQFLVSSVPISESPHRRGGGFVLKLDPSGNLLWARDFHLISGSVSSGAVTVDSSGNVYVGSDHFAGTFDVDPGPGTTLLSSADVQHDAFLIKLDAAGTVRWADQFGTANAGQSPPSFGDLGRDVEVDEVGNVYYSGIFRGTVDFDPGPGTTNLTSAEDTGYMIKLTPENQLVWATALAAPIVNGDMSVNAFHDIVFAASFSGSSLDLDPGTGTTVLNSNGSQDGILAAYRAPFATVRVEDGRGGSDTQSFTIDVTIAPNVDLTVTEVDPDALVFDGQQLTVSGTISATIRNLGSDSVGDSFDVLFFEDRNDNSSYEAGVDNVVGTSIVAAPLAGGATAAVTATLAGSVLFSGNRIWAFADSGRVIRESNETNNLGVHLCEYIPQSGPPAPAPDLTASYVRASQAGQNVTYTARIGNGGSILAPSGVNVAFYDGDPRQGGVLRGVVQTTTQLKPGLFEDVALTVAGPFFADVWVVADDGFSRTGGYVFSSFDAPGATSTTGYGINSLGQIVGQANFPAPLTGAAFLLDNGMFTFFRSPSAATYTFAASVNDSGQIVGGRDNGHGFLTTTAFGTTTPIHVPDPEVAVGNTVPTRINDAGEIVGYYVLGSSNSNRHGFLRRPDGSYTTVDYPGVTWSWAHGNNDLGQIVGQWRNDNTGTLPGAHAWIRNASGQFTTIDVPLAVGTSAADINDAGQVVGVFQDSVGRQHGFVRDTTGAFATIDVPGSTRTGIIDISDAAQIVGQWQDSAGLYHGFVGTPVGQVRECDEQNNFYHVVVPGTGEIRGTKFNDINGNGTQDNPPDGLLDVSLGFGSLPSAQGWTYSPFAPSAPRTEAQAFSTDGTVLYMNTMGQGFNDRGNQEVHAASPFQPGASWELDYRARVSQYETIYSDPSFNPFGFFVGVELDGAHVEIGMAGVVKIGASTSLPPAALLAFDTTGWHDYRFVANRTNDTFTFFIDSVLKASGPLPMTDVGFPDGIYFGDTTGGENARAEISRFHVYQIPNANSEPGLSNWTIYLDDNGNSRRDSGERFTTTDIDGNYSFPNLAPGTYVVAEEQQPGWSQTAPATHTYTLTVGAGQILSSIDFGNQRTNEPPVNHPPTFATIAPNNANVGQLFRYNARAVDPDNDALTYDLVVKPLGMAVDPSTGIVVWVPTSDQLGESDVVLRVQDGRGGFDLQSFQIDATRPNSTPVITSQPRGPAVVAVPWQYQVTTQDADGDSLTFSLGAHPAGMTIDVATGLVRWTPAANQVGSQLVAITADDGHGARTTQSFDLPVVATAPNNAPAITSTPRGTVRIGDQYLYQVVASDPNSDPLTFSLPTSPTGMTINAAGLVTWLPISSQLGANSVQVRVDDGRGGFATQTWTINVVTQVTNRPPGFISTPPQAATIARQYAYDVVATDPDGDPLSFGLDVAPAGMSIDPALGTIRWVPAGDQLGAQNVVVRVFDSLGGSATQSYSILVRAVNVPPGISSTPPTNAVVNVSYSYAVRASDSDGDLLTFELTESPTGMTIDAASGLIQWTPTAGQVGSQSIAIRVSDSQGGFATQSYTVVVSATASNLAPVITSTPSVSATASQQYSYAVTAVDPEGSALLFSLQTAPSGMSINPTSGLVQWTPGLSQLGVFVVTVAAIDPAGNAGTQSFSIGVADNNNAPQITSSPVQFVTAGLSYRYDVRATDPDGDAISYRLDTAPAGMTIDSLGRITWSPAIPDIGIQRVVVTVEDTRGASQTQTYDMEVRADQQTPRVNLIVSGNPVEVGSLVTFVVTATDNVGVAAIGLTINGQPVGLDASGRVTLVAQPVGNYPIIASASDAAGNTGFASTSLLVIDTSDVEAPNVEMTSPLDNAVISAPIDVMGTVTDSNLLFYTLSVATFGSQTFRELFRGTNSVTNGVLGKFDPSGLANDTYTLRLEATDAGGNIAYVDTVIDVAGDLKVGNFTLSFTDLTVPVSGIPITVSRTYDTLQSGQQDDLGYGWRLEFRDTNLRTNVPPSGAEEFGAYTPFNQGARVYVTAPGGRREGFTFQPVQRSSFGVNLGLYNPVFVPDAGVTSRLSVPAVTLVRSLSDGLYYGANGLAYNPADELNFGGQYFLTTKDGIAYEIDANTGDLQTLSDANGNSLTFSDDSIDSNRGSRVTFQRDPQGRIIGVTDPLGNQVRYQYDAAGDMTAVTDRDGNVTRFVYDLPSQPHYLTEVIDPLGRSGVRTEYDAQGRLITLIDAAGNPVQLAHDPDNSIETITDAQGNSTTFEYDIRGNVVTEVNALGGITRRTYDAANSMLTETDALGNVTQFTYDGDGNALTETDPLGNVTRFTYTTVTPGFFDRVRGARPVPLLTTSTDPLGNTTINSYAGMNLVSTRNAAGDVTSFAYDGAGNQTSITDALGSATTFEYAPVLDRQGFITGYTSNLIRQVDALGHVTTFTYDDIGNQLTQSTTLTTPTGVRTLVTTTAYDASGRPVRVTDAEGNSTSTIYDALGNQAATIDALGRRTDFAYDDRGQLVGMTFPDGSSTATGYDVLGRRTSSTDRDGTVTYFVYDPLGRMTETIHPDSTPGDLTNNPRSKTEYDTVGRVKAQIDELGNRTEFEYDAAGRQTVVRNALGHETTTTYDVAGRSLTMTDALGRTTHFDYDTLGRQTETTLADGTTTSTSYDVLGRSVTQTDQAGNVTGFEYDLLGRLTAVVDALSQRTEYGYDEAGNLITQRDANGHVTRYDYDGLGRRTAHVLPLGQRSTTIYNAVGNVSSTTDFNGETIQFAYDVNNRLTSKLFPDASTVQYTYTTTGQRETVIDARGVTTWDYDERDRLLSRTDPDGRAISYTYDAAGNRTSVTVPSGTIGYTFDTLNRLSTVTDPQLGVTRYTYDPVSNLIRTELPNGTVETRNYNSLNRLLFLENTGPAGVINSFRYTLDPVGNRTAVDEHNGRRVEYDYDALFRLTEETIFDSIDGDRTIGYAYDPVGNRQTRTDSVEGTTAYTYDGNDRLLTETLAGEVTQYAYDNNGNTVSKISDLDRVFYDWDFENRLISADTNGDGTPDVTYGYDADGIRVSSTIAGEETRYLIDTVQPYQQVIEEYTPAGVIKVSYVHGLDLISQNRPADTGRSFYHVDGLGSTRALTNASGLVTDSYFYDAFGRTIGQVGSTGNVYLFAGEQRDAATGLDYLRARYSDTAAGRFFGMDPFAGSLKNQMTLHRYLYAGGNPVTNVDASGKFYVLIDLMLATTLRSVLIGYQLGQAAGLGVLAMQLRWPRYGNWVGPHHGGDVYNIPPVVDDFDRAAMWHDLRYGEYGYFDAASDQRLIDDIDAALAGEYDDQRNFRGYFFRDPDPSSADENYMNQGVTPVGRIKAQYVKQYLEYGLSSDFSAIRRGLWWIVRYRRYE